jgi:hypothetical protein
VSDNYRVFNTIYFILRYNFILNKYMKTNMTVFLFFLFISLSAQEKIVLFFDLNKEVINEKNRV